MWSGLLLIYRKFFCVIYCFIDYLIKTSMDELKVKLSISDNTIVISIINSGEKLDII